MIGILIDGQLLPLGRPLIERDGKVYAPLAGGIERLADRVGIDRNGTIVVSRGIHHFILDQTQHKVWVDGRKLPAPCLTYHEHNTTYLSFETVVLALGGRYLARPGEGVIEITMPSAALIGAATPTPAWYPRVIPHQVLAPYVPPLPRWPTAVKPLPRQTPIAVGPEYRL